MYALFNSCCALLLIAESEGWGLFRYGEKSNDLEQASEILNFSAERGR
jgi:hypothetical protein